MSIIFQPLFPAMSIVLLIIHSSELANNRKKLCPLSSKTLLIPCFRRLFYIFQNYPFTLLIRALSILTSRYVTLHPMLSKYIQLFTIFSSTLSTVFHKYQQRIYKKFVVLPSNTYIKLSFVLQQKGNVEFFIK
jgi:hypothetical protein